ARLFNTLLDSRDVRAAGPPLRGDPAAPKPRRRQRAAPHGPGELAGGLAAGSGLLDRDRPRWRELCAQLLGEMKAQGPVAHQRRKNLRAPSTFQVHLLAPSDVSGLVPSSIGSGGMCVQLDRPLPVGADVELSIAVDRKEPLRARAQVVYVLDTFETGMTFIDLVQGDRE